MIRVYPGCAPFFWLTVPQLSLSCPTPHLAWGGKSGSRNPAFRPVAAIPGEVLDKATPLPRPGDVTRSDERALQSFVSKPYRASRSLPQGHFPCPRRKWVAGTGPHRGGCRAALLAA